MSSDEIVAHYVTHHRGRTACELEHYRKLSNLGDAIREAALCRLSSGKRHPHQYRIPGSVLEEAYRDLAEHESHIASATTFHELHKTVWQIISPIRGIGELAVYDIAHRIGTYMGIEPERVYLHAGTREGARNLFNLSGESLPVSDFPEAFQKLTASEIEDCLCICKSGECSNTCSDYSAGGCSKTPKPSPC